MKSCIRHPLNNYKYRKVYLVKDHIYFINFYIYSWIICIFESGSSRSSSKWFLVNYSKMMHPLMYSIQSSFTINIYGTHFVIFHHRIYFINIYIYSWIICIFESGSLRSSSKQIFTFTN